MTRRQKVWLIRFVAAAALVSILLVALPEVVRRVAISRIDAATGRTVAIKDVDLNLFTRRLAVKSFVLYQKGRHVPFVQFDRLVVRFRLLPLLKGRLGIRDLRLVSPTLHVVRTGGAQFNFSDLLPSRGSAKPAKKAGFDVTIDRLSLTGGTVILEDDTVTPSRTWKAQDLSVHVANLSTGAGGPGGTADVSFSLGATPVSLRAADIHLDPGNARGTLSVEGFNLGLLLPYLPAGAPATLKSGLATLSLAIRHRAPGDTRVGGEVRLRDLVVLRRGESVPLVSVPSLRVAITGLDLRGGALTAQRITLSGSPTVFDPRRSPAGRFDLKNFALAVDDLSWPVRAPTPVRLRSDLPVGGEVSAQGTFRLKPAGARLQVTVKGAELAPYRAYLPLSAPVAGEAYADLNVDLSTEGGLKAAVRGSAGARRLAVGPRKNPVVTVEQVDLSGLDVRWPSLISVRRVRIRKPSALIERDKNGKFPLREVFSPTSAGPPAGRAAPATRSPSPSQTRIEIGETAIEDGYGRFIDRSGPSPFREELSQLNGTLKDLTNAPDKRARVELQAVVGATSAVHLRGEVSPLGRTLFADLDGELQDFAVPTVNPYMNRLLAWVAKTGLLTTKFHFRIDGDKLEARNDIVIDRLDVAQTGSSDTVDQRIGLPLGLIVALLKDVDGAIRISVPVSGSLGSPEFSLGDAIWTAVRNSVINILAAPFKLIGSLFTKGGKVEKISIDPVLFAPGSASIGPAMEQQLQHLAGFLRRSAFVRLTLSSVVSAPDMTALKTQIVTARIQRLQLQDKLSNFRAAAVRVFRRQFPHRALPKSEKKIVAALREDEPEPDTMGRALARERLETTRDELLKAGNIEKDRLQRGAAITAPGTEKKGRVEFTILP